MIKEWFIIMQMRFGEVLLEPEEEEKGGCE